MIFMGPIEVIPLSLPLNDKNIVMKIDINHKLIKANSLSIFPYII